MIKKTALLLTVLFVAVSGMYALTIKIGTVAPAGSPWDDILHTMSGRWEGISGGAIQVVIYPGGIAGGESDMIRKMRIGQLQGAALTQLALGRIVPDILALNIPFLITSDSQFNYLLGKTRGYFEKRFDVAGYKLLAWSSAGWVHFFSTKPISSPSDLRKLRLGVPAGDDALLTAWRSLGFNAISLPIPDIMTGLQSGMIDAFYSPPSAAVVFQWFRGALHMSSFKVTPVIVGLVIDNRAWDSIPKELRPELLRTMQGVESALKTASANMDSAAIAAMTGHGLVVDPVSPADEAQWHDLAAAGAKLVVGKLISKESLGLVEGYLNDYAKNGGE
ncbi:MAG TPA: TRAP transporter substrate-binding protein DctP [Spirochaetia bacterium]|nr:TRAP transporter substrate-binding protein DctP [Spirochaetia bacterium]